jgi:hypothetical protein
LSLLLLFNPARSVVERLADPEVTKDDLRRLEEVLENAIASNVSTVELTLTIQRDVPRAAPVAALLQQGGTPLATWIAVVLAAITLLLSIREQHPEPTITPEQIREITNRAILEAEHPRKRPAPTDDTDAPVPKARDKTQHEGS